MSGKESVILFGEGKTEAVFLSHLRALYRDEIRARVNIDAGQGGSPKQVVERLIKKHLKLAAYDRSLLLLDDDLPRDDIPASWLTKNQITVVTSSPRCLEGLLLSMLNDLPPAKERHLSRNWKRRFHRNHLGTDRDAEIVSKLRGKCPVLFSRALIEFRRPDHPALDSILKFLGL